MADLRWFLVVAATVLCATFVLSYAGYLVPPGIIPPGTGSHELASVVGDDAGSTVDANANGVIDQAESCGSCGGGGGGAPTMSVFSATLPDFALDATNNPSMRGAQFPIQVPQGASSTFVQIEGSCYSPSAQSSINSLLSLTIDWQARKVRGVSQFSGRTQRWWVDDIQSNRDYCAGASICGLNLDIENRRIISLPREFLELACRSLPVSIIGTLASYG